MRPPPLPAPPGVLRSRRSLQRAESMGDGESDGKLLPQFHQILLIPKRTRMTLGHPRLAKHFHLLGGIIHGPRRRSDIRRRDDSLESFRDVCRVPC